MLLVFFLLFFLKILRLVKFIAVISKTFQFNITTTDYLAVVNIAIVADTIELMSTFLVSQPPESNKVLL